MKLLIIGVWITLVALGTAYGAAVYLPAMSTTSKTAAAPPQYQKTRVLNVPMIASGSVQGFMSLQLGFTTDPAAIKDPHVGPEVYLIDEAFRTIYSDPSLDFNNLTKFDLTKFTKHLIAATNDHLGAPVVKDVLLEQFSYISKESTKR